MRKITIMDTTLRDGEQAPGFSLNLAQKLEIAKQLERLRVDIIEAGFPIASPDDFAAVKKIAESVKECAVAGLCRATTGDISCAYEAVKRSERPRVHIFLATSDIHLEHKLHISRAEMLETAEKSVKFARKYCPEVQFIAEDALRTDREFLLEVIEAAYKAGASIFGIADTVGYAAPEEMAALISLCKARFPDMPIGVHCHDDLGMATANSLSAIKAGADQVDVTIDGIGERAGMAAIEEIAMALHVRGEFYNAYTGIATPQLYRAGKLLANSVGISIPPNKAIIGGNAFAHEAGVHQHGMMQSPLTYEIMLPADVGVHSGKLVLGKHSGKAALGERLEEMGYYPKEAELEELFARFKIMADNKKIVSDTDLEQLVYGEVKTIEQYALSSFVVNSGTDITATAVVRLIHDNMEREHVARGGTPVIAAFRAVDKIVKHSYPLHHFSIQSISEGREELGESAVQIMDGDKIITGRGIATDIVEACIRAYLNAINKALAE